LEKTVANTKSAKKQAIQSEKHRQRNASLRSMYRSAIKNVLTAIANGQKDQATAAFKIAVPVIDKMVNKGIIHKNKAARHKSRLTAALNKIK
jgi:small subunit ribosomal protein S20